MEVELPVSKEALERTPPEVIELLRALMLRNADLEAKLPAAEARIVELEAKVAELAARLKQNSTNSSKPPSSDPPSVVKRKPPQPKSGRKRGGQKGHPRHERPLVPPEDVNEIVDCRPVQCSTCSTPLAGSDPEPLRHQIAEIPPITPVVTEYRLHSLACDHCGTSTRGELPPGVPRGSFGPRLAALVAVLSGAYRLGKRPLQQLLLDLCGLTISLGMICKIQRRAADMLEGVWNDLRQYVRTQNVNIDETSWIESRRRAWLWAVVTPLAVVYRIARSRGKDVVRELLGDDYRRVATCDRWCAYRWLKYIQWCWSHLRRDFQAMIDRDGKGRKIGEELLTASDLLFHWRHRVRDGTLSLATLQRYIVDQLRPAMRRLLQQGVRCGCAKTQATCRDLTEHEERLWTFVFSPGVEPTNNAGERKMRHPAQWRKASGGTDSAGGSRYVERILTVLATAHCQGRNPLDYLAQCFQALFNRQPIPSLVPAADQANQAA